MTIINLASARNFPMDYGFEIQEACDLLNLTVVALDSRTNPPRIDEIGFICGVLTANDEVELVIKFLEEMRQYTKAEFVSQLKILTD